MKTLITLPNKYPFDVVEEELKKYPIEYELIDDVGDHYLIRIESEEIDLFFFGKPSKDNLPEPKIKKLIMEGLNKKKMDYSQI